MRDTQYHSQGEFEKLNPIAEVIARLYEVELKSRSARRSTKGFPRRTFHRLFKRKHPWIWPHNTVSSDPELQRMCHMLWGALPRFCLFIPMDDVIPKARNDLPKRALLRFSEVLHRCEGSF